MAQIKLKKCLICGRVVEVTDDKPVICCGQEMVDVVPNSVDAAVEKHVPTYEVVGDKIEVEVHHVMEPEHYIEWIAMATDEGNQKVELRPGDEPKATFKYVKGAKLYAYCNKHGLWTTDVE